VGQAKSLHRYVERNLGQIVEDPKVSVEDKSTVVYDTLVWLIDDALADPRATDLVQRGNRAAKNTATFFYQNKSALKCLMQVSVFDYSTYTHSVNVFIFSVALGQRIFPEEYVSNDFGLGALLHDVGKSMVPPEILNCRGKLSHSQFEIMKKHTVYGYDILKKNGEAPKIALTMARHHHERFLGGGYPDNLKGEEIPREVRVLTIADIFDALTTERSYKASMHSFPALKLMQNEMRGHMDPELFKIFVGMMGNPTYEE
jgi:putative nucleotidyltransferase with HDIG domain